MNTNTSALFEQAIDKLRDEMAANAKDAAMGIVGEFMTALLDAKPEYAEKIMAEKKTIKGAMEAMKAKAEKNKHGSWASMDFFSGIKCVLKYYGLPDMQNCQIMAMMNAAAQPEPQPEIKPEPAPRADSFDLDALLDELG